MKNYILAGVGTITTMAIALLPLTQAYAATETAGATVNGVIDSAISVAVSGDITINLTPTASGATATGSHNVTVSTNNSTGYKLQLSSAGSDTTLAKGSDTIAAASGTFAAPAALAVNTWGYSVGSFPSNTFAGVPANTAPVILKTTSTTAANEMTAVTYGINADTSKASGTYSRIIQYTAITN